MRHHAAVVVLAISFACARAVPEDSDASAQGANGGSQGTDAAPGIRAPDAAEGDRPDAGGGQPSGPDANLGTAQCRGVPTLAGLPLQQAFLENQPAPAPQGWFRRILNSRLDGTQTYDVLDLELWDGFGVFSGVAAHPGTFTISGEEASVATCGVCVALLADFDPNTGEFAQTYLAQSGQVTITSVNGTLAGSISNARLSRLDANLMNVVGDCESEITGTVTFSAPLQTP